jgi:hypothetical protein
MRNWSSVMAAPIGMDRDTGEVYAAGFFRGECARRMHRMTLAVDLFWSIRSPDSASALPWHADAAPPAMEALIDADPRDHERSGHWDVPSLVFDGEPFFGQDRFDRRVWRLRRHGLTRRAGTA